jgi:hypothetical protein
MEASVPKAWMLASRYNFAWPMRSFVPSLPAIPVNPGTAPFENSLLELGRLEPLAKSRRRPQKKKFALMHHGLAAANEALSPLGRGPARTAGKRIRNPDVQSGQIYAVMRLGKPCGCCRDHHSLLNCNCGKSGKETTTGWDYAAEMT